MADRERHTLSREYESLSERERRLAINNYVRARLNDESYLASERKGISEMRRAETVKQNQSRLGVERARYHLNRIITSDSDESLEYDVSNIILPWENRENQDLRILVEWIMRFSRLWVV